MEKNKTRWIDFAGGTILYDRFKFADVSFALEKEKLNFYIICENFMGNILKAFWNSVVGKIERQPE